MELDKHYYTYIMTNKHHTVLYTGKSSYLEKRHYEHKTKAADNSFTKRYNVNKLVFYEVFATEEEAAFREKQIKSGSRAKKIKLIEAQNPDWRDLSEDFSFGKSHRK